MPHRRILTFPEYAALRHPTPYLVDIRCGSRRLALLGGRHSSDPSDPMFDLIDATFGDVAPGLAMHEGTPPAIERDREVAIRRHGEAGLIRHLAALAGIPTCSMDIPLAEEARILRRTLGAQTALVFLVVRQLASFNRKTARMDFDGYFTDFFLTIGPPLELSPISWELIEREHERVLGRPLFRREVSAAETDPLRNELPTQRIARFSNRLRDIHMLKVLLRAVQRTDRVFATVGVSHAVMLEPALREALEKDGCGSSTK